MANVSAGLNYLRWMMEWSNLHVQATRQTDKRDIVPLFEDDDGDGGSFSCDYEDEDGDNEDEDDEDEDGGNDGDND